MSRENHQDIRIGTMVGGHGDPASYIEQILPHGFESFQLTFGDNVGDIDLPELAKKVKAACGDKAPISGLGIYGNPLESDKGAEAARKSWENLIDNAHHFGCSLICGFTGRLRDKPIDQSISRFKEVFTPLAKRAEDQGVKIAFENCDMGGDWWRGDWNIAQNPTAWEMMFDAVPSEVLGLEWEPTHQMVSLIDPMPQLRKWVNKIIHVHGKDGTIMWDIVREYGVHGPKPFVYHRTPGFGDSNWTDIITELRLANFKGSIDVEGWHDPVYRDELEMTGQVRALHYLKECRGGAFAPNPK